MTCSMNFNIVSCTHIYNKPPSYLIQFFFHMLFFSRHTLYCRYLIKQQQQQKKTMATITGVIRVLHLLFCCCCCYHVGKYCVKLAFFCFTFFSVCFKVLRFTDIGTCTFFCRMSRMGAYLCNSFILYFLMFHCKKSSQNVAFEHCSVKRSRLIMKKFRSLIKIML